MTVAGDSRDYAQLVHFLINTNNRNVSLTINNLSLLYKTHGTHVLDKFHVYLWQRVDTILDTELLIFIEHNTVMLCIQRIYKMLVIVLIIS